MSRNISSLPNSALLHPLKLPSDGNVPFGGYLKLPSQALQAIKSAKGADIKINFTSPSLIVSILDFFSIKPTKKSTCFKLTIYSLDPHYWLY